MSQEQVQKDLICLNTCLSALASAGEWQKALIFLRQMEGSADVVSLTAAISACGAAIQWQHALALLNAGGDMVLDVRCYNSCLAACENASAWMSALALLTAMSVAPTVVTWNSAMSACSSAALWQRSLLLWFGMPKQLIQPDIISLGIAVTACEKGAQWQLALNFLQHLDRSLPPTKGAVKCAGVGCFDWCRGIPARRFQKHIMLKQPLGPLGGWLLELLMFHHLYFRVMRHEWSPFCIPYTLIGPGMLWQLGSFALCLTQVPETAATRAAACAEAIAREAEVHFRLSGAPVLHRPDAALDVTFDVSEQQLLDCQRSGKGVPWRFGHALLCVASSCDEEDLVRHVALPAFLEALGVEMTMEELQEMQPLYRLGHWKDMRADFVVAGFESGGSSSVVNYLHRIPDIYIMPFELSDWARDFASAPLQDPSCEDEVSYWPAFMSFAYWPAAETVERFNRQVERCGARRVGVWDSRYATHDIARRKIQALLADKDSARVILCFRDPVLYVISSFNRLSPDSAGGGSLLGVLQGTDVDPDPFGLRLWKGNYTLLARKMAAAVGIMKGFLTLAVFFCHEVTAAVLSEDRRSCPYYQTSGCILDQLEKVCEGEGAEMIAPNAGENVWMCCCPKPYVPCAPNESDKTCVKAIASEIKASGDLKIKGLMKVREQLLKSSEQCSPFYMPQEEAKCGTWPKDMPHLMCEMLTWQWEELGDGNEAEFQQYDCPMIQEKMAKDGDARKGHALSWDPRHREL
eukprot:symbB.v1.2.021965.t1/scaffold1899.1/size238565/1